MTIYRYLKLRMNDQAVLEEDSYDYSGPMSECKGGGSTAITTPSPDQAPYLKDVWAQAQGISQQPLEYYPGQTVSGFTPEQQLAQGLTMNRALMGNPLVPKAQETMMDTLSGKYMDPNSNPWLEQSFNKAAGGALQKFGEATIPQIKSAALSQGAYGGDALGVAEGIASRNLQGELGDIATGIYGPAYQQERAFQQQAMTQAPGLAEADYGDIGKIAAVGEEKQGLDQALIDAAKQVFQWYQTEPTQRLQNYANLVSGEAGGVSTGTYSGK